MRSHRVRVKKCANTETSPLSVAPRAAFLVVLALGLVRPVDHQRLALDVLARQEAPVAAVLRVVAVVAHHEVLVRRHRDRSVSLAHVERGHFVELRVGRRRLQEMHVRLVERLAVDVDLLLAHFDRLARQPDDALDEVALRLLGILEDDDVAALDGRRSAAARARGRVAVGPNTNLFTSR